MGVSYGRKERKQRVQRKQGVLLLPQDEREIGEGVQGFDSSLFAIATVLAFVVLYDAQGIRRQAGNQARIINRMLQNVENAGIKVDKNLKELLGHTPIQVMGGTILGIIVALVMN